MRIGVGNRAQLDFAQADIRARLPSYGLMEDARLVELQLEQDIGARA